MITGREKEIRELNELYESGSAELIALYGRRRVGKTFLVDEVFGSRISFRHAGLSPIDDRYSSESKTEEPDERSTAAFSPVIDHAGHGKQEASGVLA